MTPRSSQPTALCHSKTIEATNAMTGIASPNMLPTFWAVLTSGKVPATGGSSRTGSGDRSDRLERRLQCQLPIRRDRVRRCPLLALDPLGHAHGLLIARPVGDPLQLLVRRDLEVLEGVVEAGELRGSVRLRREEAAPVEGAEAHRRVLQLVRARVVRVQARLDYLLLGARFSQVLLEQLCQPRLLDDLGGGLHQHDRLDLDRMR